MKHKTLLLTLKVFSATGGIEKVCRVAGKALYEIHLQGGGQTKIFSMHDGQGDAAANPYLPQELFTGFGAHKIKFVRRAVAAGMRANTVILSHINLLKVGWLIKRMNPRVRLILLAHGIEVWEPLSGIKKRMLAGCDLILPVSQFTKNKIMSLHGIAAEKCRVLNNCLDPFLPVVIYTGKDKELIGRYGFAAGDRVLLTLTRLAAGEQYKGYDKVLKAMERLVPQYPNLRYLIAGKYDAAEKERLDGLIAKMKLQGHVVFAGFVPEAELAAHFNLADMYVMPSSKEGFGIVFIEAMYYGLPVIAGYRDGSVDALRNGELGLLVDPDSTKDITTAIKKVLEAPGDFIPDQQLLETHFSYSRYKKKLREMLEMEL